MNRLMLLAACLALVAAGPAVAAEQPAAATTTEQPVAATAAADPGLAVAREENGRSYNADDIPTFKIAPDGTVDWATFSGYRRYHSDCHVCHGPDGEGSSYAPALKDSVMTMDYYDFVDVITNGRQKVNAAENSVMPAFGMNPNVICYVEDIWTYLRAHGSGAIQRGRPAKKEAKSDEYVAVENACMGTK